IEPATGRVLENFKLRVLVVWVCRGPTPLQLLKRVGENAIATKTRVRNPVGATTRNTSETPVTSARSRAFPASLAHRVEMGRSGPKVPETEIPWHRNGTRVRLWIRLHCARSRADDRVPMTAVGWHATSLEVDGGRDEADST